jgi:hypothetical protein
MKYQLYFSVWKTDDDELDEANFNANKREIETDTLKIFKILSFKYYLISYHHSFF